MTNILSGLIDGTLTEDEAYDLIEDIIDKFHSGEIEGEVKDLLGLNNFEWTAICHALD